MLNTLFKALLDFIRNWFKEQEEAVELEKSVQGRFLRLFEEHGVHKNQIPSFFGHGITLQDVATPESLLKSLNDEILEDASTLFGVSLEWLKGASDTIFPINRYYKNVDRFLSFIQNLKSNGKMIGAELYLSTDNNWGENAVLVISEELDCLGSDEVHRYHICGGWTHVYGKARADLVACIAILLNHNVNPRISWVRGSVEKCATGNGFPSSLHKMKRDKRVTSKLSKFFRAEKWVTTPSDFEYLLAEGDYGKITAIYRWIKHYESGYLETDGGSDLEPVADIFKVRYKEISGKTYLS